jgi:hypothetical protein
LRAPCGSASASSNRSTNARPRSFGVAAIHSATPCSASLLEDGSLPSRKPCWSRSRSMWRKAGSGWRPLPSSVINSQAARSTGAAETDAPARRAARRSSAASRAFVAFSRALWITWSSSSLKDARVRLRGPSGVLLDSRISNRPDLVGTMKAIVGIEYHYVPTGSRLGQTSPRETAWLATMRPFGSHLCFVSPRRSQTSGGRIASTSQGPSVKL